MRRPEGRVAGRRLLLALAGAVLLTSRLVAQQSASLAGTVKDPAGDPIPDARVRVIEAAREATTDAAGAFRLAGLPSGTHRVTVIRVGFQPATHRVDLRAGATTLQVTLTPAVLTIEPLQVTATALPTSLPDAPQAIAVLDSTELRRARAPSLGETVQGVPGVQNYGTGPAIGKPAVRGLSGNRVLVVADGQRLEFQQWGEEHAPSLELQEAAAIEVVRGPASVLYGSDALG
ncbi:MAG TPA: TonB-dependent receptor plug domain-containing protein, partial [Gemmatimonadales bacterium]|nr:TonB-dependent receptor plug domain-containing protein [Gemmatimonadales bacterium]